MYVLHIFALLRNSNIAANCVFIDNTPHTPCVCACCVHACVSARLLLKLLDLLSCLHAGIPKIYTPTVDIRSHDNYGQ